MLCSTSIYMYRILEIAICRKLPHSFQQFLCIIVCNISLSFSVLCFGWKGVHCDIVVEYKIFVHMKEREKVMFFTHLTLLPRTHTYTNVCIQIYPWGCGLTFASNMLWNFDYVFFSLSHTHSIFSPLFQCQVKK